ncbi:MAG: DUF1462 family protein [Chloroflexota bacterium]|nr:DUF1462 family protein [Chloroflexota bacterium]
MTRVVIFADSQVKRCPGCGIECGVGEPADLVTQRLQDRFGQGVEIEYVDLSDPGARVQHEKEVRQIEEQELFLPVVAIEGVFRLAGSLEYRRIAEAIEVLRENSDGI